MNDILIVLCTFPDLGTARETGTALVESQLAACVNLIPAAWPRFESRLRELHPYDVPEIVALKPEQLAEGYASWVGECVRDI